MMKYFVFLGIFIMTFSCIEEESNKSRVAYLPFFDEPSFTPHWFSPESDSLKGFHHIPDFTFINQDGKSISQSDLVDKIYVANFFFTVCPGICPQMTDNMKLLQGEFINDDDLVLLSHSVTPTRDSVAVLKAYADKRGIQSDKWHLLTGDRSIIYNLGRKAYFVEEDMGILKSEDDFLHTENLVLIDKNRHIRGVYNGLNKASIQQLVDDVKSLQVKS